MSKYIAFHWIKNSYYDIFFFILPSFVSLFLAYLFSFKLTPLNTFPNWAWLIFVLGFDVSHVYGTLFKTYFNSHNFAKNKKLYIFTPLFVFIISVFIYNIEPLFFWRILAYLAVFHFIRQQYGFMRIYARFDSTHFYSKRFDSLMIYFVTLYPLFYWHTHLPRNFNWFIPKDFIPLPGILYFPQISYIYFGIYFIYFLKEIFIFFKEKNFNLPKNLLIVATSINWYIGIILFNNDFIFTLTNVLAHGIPYMALIWAQKDQCNSIKNSSLFFKFSAPTFLLFLLIIGYLEEALWDIFIWKEHPEFFPFFQSFEEISKHEHLSILIPLLSMPQVTHYFLDGFIWKKDHSNK